MKYFAVTHVAKSGGPSFEQQALLCTAPLRIGIGSRIHGKPDSRQENEVGWLRSLGTEGGFAIVTYGDMPVPSPDRAFRLLVCVKRGTPLIQDTRLGGLFTLVVTAHEALPQSLADITVGKDHTIRELQDDDESPRVAAEAQQRGWTVT